MISGTNGGPPFFPSHQAGRVPFNAFMSLFSGIAMMPDDCHPVTGPSVPVTQYLPWTWHEESLLLKVMEFKEQK